MNPIDVVLFPFRIMYAFVMFTIGGLKAITRTAHWGYRTTKIVKGHVTKELRCPQGHSAPADSVWECGSCGARRMGFAWKECPACRKAPSHVDCPECGLAIVNPAA